MANKSVEKYVPGIKAPAVRSSFNMEAAKINYQAILQNLSSITITRDNVNDDLGKPGREILKALKNKKEAECAEPLQWHRDVMAIYNDLANPIEEQIERLKLETKEVATKIHQENEAQRIEEQRIADAKNAIINFTNKVSQLIMAAKTDDDIISIEKMIGLEKTRKSIYQEFLPDLSDKCEQLRPQIKTQKDFIRQLEETKKKEQEALSTGDAVAAAELREQKEYFEQAIQETGLQISETAFNSASEIEVIVPEVVDTAPKGRTHWKWRIDDIKLLQKKMPHLVQLVPNEEAINEWLKSKRTDGSLSGKETETINGITFYNDRRF